MYNPQVSGPRQTPSGTLQVGRVCHHGDYSPKSATGFSRPEADFGTPDLNLGSRGRHFGPGTLFDQFVGPPQTTFVEESFCGEVLGKSSSAQIIAWSLGLVWVGSKTIVCLKTVAQFHIFPKNMRRPPAYFP